MAADPEAIPQFRSADANPTLQNLWRIAHSALEPRANTAPVQLLQKRFPAGINVIGMSVINVLSHLAASSIPGSSEIT